MKSAESVTMNEGDIAIILRSNGCYEVHSCVTEEALADADAKANIERNMGIAVGINCSLGMQASRTAFYELGMTDGAIEQLAEAQGTTSSVN